MRLQNTGKALPPDIRKWVKAQMVEHTVRGATRALGLRTQQTLYRIIKGDGVRRDTYNLIRAAYAKATGAEYVPPDDRPALFEPHCDTDDEFQVQRRVSRPDVYEPVNRTNWDQ